MAQWAQDRGFVEDEGNLYIRVIASVDTGGDPFARINTRSTIVDLVLTHVTGDTRRAVAKLEELKAAFIGKPIAEWHRGGAL